MSNDVADYVKTVAPTIYITCTRVPVGQSSQYILDPALTITHMPGGWAGVHKVLLDCLEKVAAQMVTEAQNQGRVQVATQMPTEAQNQGRVQVPTQMPPPGKVVW